MKKFIEMRGADGGPWRRLCALPAFWVGICYNQSSLDAAWDLAKRWDIETLENWRIAASVDGLDAIVNGQKMIDIAKEVVSIAQTGLKARAKVGAQGLLQDESHFLNALSDSLDIGKTPADELLDLYYGEWDKDLNRIFENFCY